MQNQVIRTPDEIEALKKSWIAYGEDDIEDTIGFEAHREELASWRENWMKERESEDLRRLEQEAKRQGVSVDQAREIRTQERLSESSRSDAMRCFRNFFRNVDGLFEDFDGEADSMMRSIIDAAVAEAKIAIIRGVK